MSATPSRPVQYPRARPPARRSRRSVLLGLGAVGLAALALTLPGLVGGKDGASPARPAAGAAPAFAEEDVLTGNPLTSEGLRGRNVLLFFNEGASCQACLEQIRVLEERKAELERRSLTLVSVTTDPPEVLAEAARLYGITTALVSDEDRTMSRAYAVLGQGMHPDTAGHTFVLVDGSGAIRWRRDYETMFVPADELLAEIPEL